jgi:hypothetical protein
LPKNIHKPKKSSQKLQISINSMKVTIISQEICRVSKKRKRLFSLDQHKAHQNRRRLFAFNSDVTYDLEGLGAGAGLHKKRKRLFSS